MSSGARRTAIWLNGICVVALLVGGVTAVFLVDDGDTVSRPQAWDPRVQPLTQFVERERGHAFTHPVQVDFLSPADYSAEVQTDEGSLTDEDREDIERTEAMLRAVGLWTGSGNLLDVANNLADDGTLAYYDDTEERVVVRGTEVTPALSATLVHELTHVLQDQTFGLDRFDEEDEGITDGQMAGFHALVEGDANRIEENYVETLSADDQGAIDGARTAGSDAFLEKSDSTMAITALFAAPYILGDAFVAVLDNAGDVEIDEAFADPPSTEEHLLDPFQYLEGDKARPVATPDVGDLEVDDDGDFGAMALLVVLAERVGIPESLHAVTGWGGDAYVVFRENGRTCARIDVTGDTLSDTDELEGALRTWVEAGPDGTASVTRTGDLVRLDSCDPGASAAAGSGRSLEALSLVNLRSQLAIQGLDADFGRRAARCFAGTVVTRVDAEEITSDNPSSAAVAMFREIAQECRVD